MNAIPIEQVLAEEAAALNGTTVDRAEAAGWGDYAKAQRPEALRAHKDADIRSATEEDPDDVECRRAFYRSLNKLNRAALCLSGGGIRSATFCLGVIQALAKHRASLPPGATPAQVAAAAESSLLGKFHYLSTVSGGGYIGSWLSAWRARSDFPTVWRNLTDRPEGPDVEPPEISWLRSYSNYLTPKVGLWSADTWTGIAIFLRNLLLNWLVIVPALAVVLLILKLIATGSIAVARMETVWPHLLTALLGVACLIAAQAFITRHRPTRRDLPNATNSTQTNNITQRTYLAGCLLFSLFSAFFLTSFLTSHVGVALTKNLSSHFAVAIGAVCGAVIFAPGWLAGKPQHWEAKDFWAWTASGLVYGGLMGFGAHIYTWLNPYVGEESIWIILIPVIVGVAWVLVSQLLAEMVFVGLVSYEPKSDADREWLGRGAGWIAATAVIWGVTTFVVFAAGHFLIDVQAWLGKYIASAGGIAGIIAAALGHSAQTSAKKDGGEGWKEKIATRLAGPMFGAALVVLLSVALDLLLLGDSLVEGLTHHTWTLGYIVRWLVIGLLGAWFVAYVASRAVNINRFSLHALYRNRLVRAYLGASRQKRTPDQFTGFDSEDNPRMHRLWPPKKDPGGGNKLRLFHVVNIALNVVQAKRLAWQQRKAESFTVSALHSGAAYKGFRPSRLYGDGYKPESRETGISLGTALAISGAAASPNMGYHSSSSMALLLALFNVRLGWWLGNPGKEGDKTYVDEGPATAIKPLVEETFGLTTDDRPYVYLSDGGHFENLGVYEMVRRRCQFIIAVDAGCDEKFGFEDLGNAVRKVYIDLGIRITFDRLYGLRNRPTDMPDPNKPIPYYALGLVDYAGADGSKPEENGVILYVKPAYHGTEGAGIRSYAALNPTFPHKSTGDQFFTESQFESYRSLGLDVMTAILDGPAGAPFNRDTVDGLLKGGPLPPDLFK